MIRKMDLADVPRVAEVWMFSWRNAFRGIISDEDLFKGRLVVDGITMFEETLKKNTSQNYVFDDGIIKAFLTMYPCQDEDKAGTFELAALYVDTFFQKQGIGAQMIEFFEEQVRRCGCNEVCLWTLEKSRDSRAFYEKVGYVHDGACKLVTRLALAGVRYTKKVIM